MLSSIFNILNINTVSPLCVFALCFLVINFQSWKLNSSTLVFTIRLISQKLILIFKSRNTVLKMKHSSVSSPNDIKIDEISAAQYLSLTNCPK